MCQTCQTCRVRRFSVLSSLSCFESLKTDEEFVSVIEDWTRCVSSVP